MTMKHILAAIFAVLFCATAHAQTIKALGYNITNGHVAYAVTNTLAFTNAVSIPMLSISNATFSSNGFKLIGGPAYADFLKIDEDEDDQWSVGFNDPTNGAINAGFTIGATGFYFLAPITYANKGQARTNIDLKLPLLTNTNAVNFQAALFSTNTAPTNTTNTAAWVTLQVGTNTFRVPAYQ
jgi:hypothetical protein